MILLPSKGRSQCTLALAVFCGLIVLWPVATFAQSHEVRIVALEGKAEVLATGANNWILTQTNQVLRTGDRLRTLRDGRVSLRWGDGSVVSFGPLTEIEILPPHEPNAQSGLQLFRGILSFFHREKPSRLRVITRGAIAGVEGTDFVMHVQPFENTERTTLYVVDGRVDFRNEQGGVVVTNGYQAVAEPGKTPVLIAGFVANNVLQWAFYYPAVLYLGDLGLAEQEQKTLATSLASYREGDLLKALAAYPPDRQPASESERIYYAALVLSVGQVEKAEAAMAGEFTTERLKRLATALRQLIAAVKRQQNPATLPPETATEFLASSYYEQSRALGDVSLEKAREDAREAVSKASDFGFTWARLAELEMSFGRNSAALKAVERSLELGPRNAQALALKGFLLAAQNRPREAIEWFDKAIAVDPRLGNAWLGRGLARIRTGQSKAGHEDLLIAAAIEPQRSLLRSYLGKSYRDAKTAEHELDLAKTLDPGDPTPWLYSALLKAQHNRINEAIRDLEESQDLNENRRVYRSQLLLDQDRSVRSANLASIYRDAGMRDWSVLEASHAVTYDYANYSAHLFLANSYDELRDPNRLNLRYETPAEVEYLVANLLAPASAGILSYATSQQEYFRLLERDRVGISSVTEYLSRGAWLERGAQYGIVGNTAYSFEALYRSDRGQRINNNFEERDLRLHLKQQLTQQDSVYAQIGFYDAEGGDIFQHHDPALVNTGVRFREKQEPQLTLGYHREWYPGMHTLAIAGRLEDEFSVEDPSQIALFANPLPKRYSFLEAFPITQQYRSMLEIYFGEIQQIWQQPKHTSILGGRFQAGDFRTTNFQIDPRTTKAPLIVPTQGTPASQQEITDDFERISIYAYHGWHIAKPLTLFGGMSYDQVTFPRNFRAAPILEGTETTDQISPKAGLVWSPGSNTVVRAAYTRSLGGASLDQSVQLEPIEVAGFLQSFRSILPEADARGGQEGAEFETIGLSLQHKFGHGTYVALAGQVLRSDIDRTFGVFEFVPRLGPDPVYAYTNIQALRDHLEYEEQSVILAVNQLLGDDFAVGARYRLAEADLDQTFPQVRENPASNLRHQQHLDVTLHELNLHLLYNSAVGAFSRFEAVWYEQHNRGYNPTVRGDAFWQLNAFAGYRFTRRRAEIQVGILNITDQDYGLNPLTLYHELPHQRTLAVRLQVSF